MKRLDVALVEWGLAPTRSKAQQLIAAGEVEIRAREAAEWIPAAQAGAAAPERERVRLRADSRTLKYVSRGGLKLEGALAHLALNVSGWRCLDVGVSTGGFADCLLQHGAAAVLGFDVGHGQLHPRLSDELRLEAHEGLHVKDAPAFPPVRKFVDRGCDLAVADLSFISIRAVLPDIHRLLPTGARLLALVKPQFEVGAENLSKQGLVRDANLFDRVRLEVLNAASTVGFDVRDYFPSRVKGQDGNQEFFVFGVRP